MDLTTLLLATSLLNFSTTDLQKIYNSYPNDYMRTSEVLQEKLKEDGIKSKSLLSDDCVVTLSEGNETKSEHACTTVFAANDYVVMTPHLVITLILDPSNTNTHTISYAVMNVNPDVKLDPAKETSDLDGNCSTSEKELNCSLKTDTFKLSISETFKSDGESF